ncbi:MAG: GNAT family N-acetyltransferase [Bdellovibrio sp.]|nr:GNAT family N-acetyltransferase [Bdellovibrio sp.]
MLTIRYAEPQDSLQILKFIKALAEYEKLSAEVVATEEKLRQTLFEEKSAEVLIAFWNNEPAGFALFFSNYSTFLAQKGIYLEVLFVNPELRGKGIGKKLLKHLAQIAKDRNCGRLEWSVLDWNKDAIDFYVSIGAKPNDEWTTYRMNEKTIAEFTKN